MFCAPEINEKYLKLKRVYKEMLRKNIKKRMSKSKWCLVKYLTLKCSSDEDEKQWDHDYLLVEGDVNIPSEFCLAHACVESGLVTSSIFSVSF